MPYITKRIQLREANQYSGRGYEIVILAKKKVNVGDFIIDKEKECISDVKYDMEIPHGSATNVLDPRDTEPPTIDSDNILSSNEPPRIKYHFDSGAKGAAALLMVCAIRLKLKLHEQEIVDIIGGEVWRSGKPPPQDPIERYQTAKDLIKMSDVVFSTELISPSKKKRKSISQNLAYLLRDDIADKLPKGIRKYLEEAHQRQVELSNWSTTRKRPTLGGHSFRKIV